ncbi:MAG TPA: glycosyltransferase, partial [Humisphaera sp.]|nr:glycosyltransferase [Humisphaera sp.]
AFTESLNPIKLFEYLAAGKPIVATDVAGFREAFPWVRIANTPGEFVQAALESLNEDSSLAASRHEESRRHSWKARVDQVEEFIASLQAANVG